MRTATKLAVQDLYEETARRFAERVRERFSGSVHSVVLYGSVARKAARKDSDIDVLVLTDEGEALAVPLHNLGYALDEEQAFRTDLSPIAMTPARLEELRLGGFPIAAHVMEEGLVLHDDGVFAQWREKGPVSTKPGEEYIRARIERAEAMLSDAALLIEARRAASAADRSYYAMLNAAEAALAIYGVEPARTHKGVLSQFGERLVKPGILEKHLSSELSETHKLRLLATYEAFAQLDQEQAEDIVERARRFVERVKELARDVGR